ncbi:MAG: DUF6873 family GME fold protein [Clostridium sp.]
MYCFIDYRTTKEELDNLYKLGLEPIIIPKTSLVYEAINGHVDIQLNILSKKDKLVIVSKDINKNFLSSLKDKKINYILSHNSLGFKYPNDIILNGLILENFFIHNLNFTDKALLESQKDKKNIHVKQGYTKCSILPIREKAIITSDKNIAKELLNYDFDVLLLPPGDIILPSLNYGFIGGTGGMISENKLALFGELSNYAYGLDIYSFLYKLDVEPISLRKGKLIDRGSLLTL